MPNQQFDESVSFVNAFQMTNATTPGAWNGNSIYNSFRKRVDVIQISNSDSVAHNIGVDWAKEDGTGIVGSVLVPARAGYDGSPPVDALAAIYPASFHWVVLEPTYDVFFALGETITAGQVVTVNLSGGLV